MRPRQSRREFNFSNFGKNGRTVSSKDLETQKVIQIIEGNLTPITQYRKDRQMDKVAELEPEYTELESESYAISESSWSDEDSDDDNEFDFSFDELEIFDEF